MYKSFEVSLANSSAPIYVTKYDPSLAVEKQTDVGPIHHIFMLDRSGSMSGSIRGLVDNVKSAIELLSDEDFVSVIWFSGVGQFRTLIKGARKGKFVDDLLDTIKSTVGLTCFSEAMVETQTIVNELKSICPTFSVNLFTDGNPVVNWSDLDEFNKCYAVAAAITQYAISINTIGYGNYYNQDFLRNLASYSQFGTFTHSRNIEQFLEIFQTNIEVVSGMVNQVTAVEADEVIYLGPKSVLYSTEVLSQRQRSKNKNIYYAIGENVQFNDDKIDAINLSQTRRSNEKPTPQEFNEFLYAYAYSLYYQGDRKQALNVLLTLGDKDLIDAQLAAFTFDEVAAYTEMLKKCVLDSSLQSPGQVDEDYLPSDDAFCLMDLFSHLQKNSSVYIPFSKNTEEYKRIGKKTEQAIDLFVPSKNEVKATLDDMVYNSEHLNLSVRFSIDGKVKINPNQAKDVGLPTEIDSNIFRTHTFIKDGNLNIKQAEFMVTQEALYSLYDEVDFTVLDKQPEDAITDLRVLIDLESIPIISYKYVKDVSIQKLHDLTNVELALEAEQKVLNYMLTTLNAAGKGSVKKTAEFKTYTAAQIKVLEDHGLSKQMVYGGVGNSQALAEDCDFYETRTMKFYIKGISTLPSMNDYFKRVEEMKTDPKKKLTAGHQALKAALELIEANAVANHIDLKIGVKTKRWLEDELRTVKSALFSIRTSINALKLAKLLTGDWFDGLEVDDKGNYIHESAASTLIANVSRTKQYIN